ncbi:hemerythrin domain-containing protein [Candidatus Pacearchaeota archaeon]|nr:hemerythrin domain-containing protein [Candidatus Pacearchaeota archaeon]
MTSIEAIRKEHVWIERELIEIETIIEEEEVNYPNLAHVFKRLFDYWDVHEEKEDALLKSLSKGNSINKMLSQHKELKGHKKVIQDAINSGNDIEVKATLDTDVRFFIDKIRIHISQEEELFNSLR